MAGIRRVSDLGTRGTVNIADGSVTSGKIVDGAVTANDLNSNWFSKQREIQQTFGDFYIRSNTSSDIGKIVLLQTEVYLEPITVNVNTISGWVTGQSITYIRITPFPVTFVAGGGMTLVATPGTKMRAQYSYATLTLVGASLFVLSGDLSA